jgi:hypothetical protein
MTLLFDILYICGGLLIGLLVFGSFYQAAARKIEEDLERIIERREDA